MPGLGNFRPQNQRQRRTAVQSHARAASRKRSSPSAFQASNLASEQRRKSRRSELKRWLDEGRPLTLLDTRNDYEVKLGTFKNAVTLGIDHFRSFPTAIRQLPAELKQQPIVMFCTGGIRCEKAGPYMEREGFEQVFQLDGGILKYFEDCGGEHYSGECFVFDKRVGVDSGLAESENTQCFNCLEPLSAADQARRSLRLRRILPPLLRDRSRTDGAHHRRARVGRLRGPPIHSRAASRTIIIGRCTSRPNTTAKRCSVR